MPQFDELADCYDETRGGEKEGRRLAHWVESLIGGPGTVLELGVGTGLIARVLAELGRVVVGVDISAAMLAHARRRGVRLLVAGDGRGLPLRSACVDHAVVIRLFQLVKDHRPYCDEIARVVRPGGRVVVSPVCPGRPSDPIGQWYWDVGYRQRQSVDRLVAVGAASGFEVVGVVRGEPRVEWTSPNDEAARFGKLWKREVGPDHPLRLLPDPDEPLAVDMTWHALVLQRRRETDGRGR